MTQRNNTTGYRSFRSSLELVGNQHALRCDAKLVDTHFREWENEIMQAPFRELGDFLPNTFVKGIQPQYLEELTDDSILVVNTLSIQNLLLHLESCRNISSSEFDEIDESRKLRSGDVLLTMDGGVSIGKPLNFTCQQAMTMDSHIALLRPEGISPLGLTYLLASPLCQQQFRRSESGASGQTSVTEDDVRRFQDTVQPFREYRTDCQGNRQIETPDTNQERQARPRRDGSFRSAFSLVNGGAKVDHVGGSTA